MLLYDACQARTNALAQNKRVREVLDRISSRIAECVSEGMFKTDTITITVVLMKEELVFIKKNFEARGYNISYRKEGSNTVLIDVDWT